MSLTTPEKIRQFQRKLYEIAKQKPDQRFHALYDKVWRRDILEHSYALCRANAGASGVDGVTFGQIEEQGLEAWITALQEELRTKTYKPSPVRRAMVHKPGGGERPLGIPTIRDRVVQGAAKLVLEPIFEADFADSAFGYRPGRDASQAVETVHRGLQAGFTDVVDADLSKYFDTIPHHELMQSVARRVVDRHMLKLVKAWLKVPVEERDERGRTRMTGGKNSTRGTPQGGVLSPLLANIYMHRYLRAWQTRGKGEEFQARIVNYADDFVILSRDKAEQALTWTKAVMTKIGLVLNEKKTRLCDARTECFDFLGYSFGPEFHRKHRRWYLAARPSKKAKKRLAEKVRGVLRKGIVSPWDGVVMELNRVLRGWANYFSYGSLQRPFEAIDKYVEDRVRDFLARRHKLPTRGGRAIERLLGQGPKVYRLSEHRRARLRANP
jgi:RNA-directed DNA polymerase